MNLAFLAKLGLRIMNDEECLWIKMMKNKYSINDPNPATWRPKANMSNAWKGIVESITILQAGTKKLIRSGRETLFWMDNWVGNKPLNEEVIAEIPDTDLLLTVADYWEEEQEWNWQALSHLIYYIRIS